jgi:hypothetical protein
MVTRTRVGLSLVNPTLVPCPRVVEVAGVGEEEEALVEGVVPRAFQRDARGGGCRENPPLYAWE